MPEPARPLVRVLKILLLAVAAFVLLIAIGAFLCAQTESGRAFVARRLEHLVTSNIPGRLEIGKITRLALPEIDAYDVKFFHADGRCLLHVEKATVVLDGGEALAGRLGFRSVAADGGFMILSTDPDGRLSFEATVNAPTKPHEPHDPNGGLHYALRSMHIQNFRVRLKLGAPLDDYRISKVSGFVGIERIDTPGTKVILEKLRGDVQPDIAGQHVTLTRLDGWVHGKEKKVVQAEVGLHIGSGQLDAHVDFYDREKEKLKVRVEKSKGAEADAVTWLMHAVAGFTGDFTVDGDG